MSSSHPASAKPASSRLGSSIYWSFICKKSLKTQAWDPMAVTLALVGWRQLHIRIWTLEQHSGRPGICLCCFLFLCITKLIWSTSQSCECPLPHTLLLWVLVQLSVFTSCVLSPLACRNKPPSVVLPFGVGVIFLSHCTVGTRVRAGPQSRHLKQKLWISNC